MLPRRHPRILKLTVSCHQSKPMNRQRPALRRLVLAKVAGDASMNMLQELSPFGRPSAQSILDALDQVGTHHYWSLPEGGAEEPGRGSSVARPAVGHKVVDQRESEPSPAAPCVGAGLSSTSANNYHSMSRVRVASGLFRNRRGQYEFESEITRSTSLRAWYPETFSGPGSHRNTMSTHPSKHRTTVEIALILNPSMRRTPRSC